ncbi:MAG: AsmA family protein [candidate division KSB1 bacterium]|nr:AsmA family protein [candidate division KSB1 bacterium]MDZ7272631.1 AsmA family protein [candidate division KSB1 bacterium]MDZ7284347.1 AsmA family protein [candidate division KSB1 bacterium]MDZ7297257.1 AsmA family protein [candidate division KSB1 bacterium]MDZ7307567.1 AsmA family protein [candidate division KSB1 bacterium]
MKRLARILLFLLLAVLLLAAGATVYLRIRYPAERLKEILITTLAENYGVRLAVGRLRFNLFSGFTLEGVTLAAMKAGDAPAPLAIARIEFSYRFLSLLQRRLEIDGIAIVQPRLFYLRPPDGASNLDELLAAFADSSAAPATDTAATALPVGLALKSLALTGIAITAQLATDSTSQRVTLAPFDLTLSDLAVDRAGHLQAAIALDCRTTTLDYFYTATSSADTLTLRTALAAEIRGRLVNRDSLSLTAAVTVTPRAIRMAKQPAFSLPMLGLHTQAAVNFATGRITVPEFQLMLAGEEQVAAQLSMTREQESPRWAVQITRGRLELARLLQLVRIHPGTQLLPALANIEAAGLLDFSGTEISGAAGNVQINFTLAGRDLSYRDRRTRFGLEHGRLRLSYATRPDSAGASLSANTDFASLVLPLDSMTVLQTGPASVTLTAELNADQLPTAARAALAVENFAGARINGNIHLQPARPSRLAAGQAANDFALAAGLEISNLELAAFTADSLRGRLSGDFTLRGPSLRNLTCALHLRNEPLTYLTSDDAGDIPADHLSTTAQLALSPDFTHAQLTDGHLRFGAGSARFNVDYQIKKSALRVNLSEGTLDLAKIIALLPHHLLGDSLFPAPHIAGTARLAGWLQSETLANGEMDYRGEFTVQTTDAVYEDSTLGLYMKDVQLDTRWSLTPAAAFGEFQARCAAPRLPDYLKAPLPETRVRGVLVAGTDDFAVREGRFEIPAWRLDGRYQVQGRFLANAMQVKTEVALTPQAQPAIAPAAGVSFAGKVHGRVTIEQLLPDDPFAPQPARIDGFLQLQDCEVAVDTLLALHDLDAELHFAQRYTSRLQGRETKITLQADDGLPAGALADAGESLLLYEMLRQPVPAPDTPRSHFSIARLEVMGYRLEDIAAEVRLANSRFDLPQIRMKFLDGNFLGNVLVGLGDGSPGQLSYATTLQISSIDISRLRPLTARFEKGSRLSADFRLQGSGTSPDQLVHNLSGRLNITKIENKVAENLLQALDPKGTDRGIQNMRLLLKTKWNVRSMSFEIKNGFIYASLEPVKPWFSPFTLPSPIDFARLPLRYFLESPDSQ